MLSAIVVESNITLNFKGQALIINSEKNPDTFKKVESKIKEGDVNWLQDNFGDLREDILSKDKDIFEVVSGDVFLRGSDVAMPEVVIKQLRQLEKDGKSILPLLKFWNKLQKNPSENSRKDLYEFMLRNNIPITEEGDIVTEKGVNQKRDGLLGELVDCHSGEVDNSVGSIVEMDRDKVNPDSNQTCSYGLHVGAPDYVRNVWSSDVIVECVVNPVDVVSVPSDYKATKMRVCKYIVAGYSSKTERQADKVVKLSDFITEPTAPVKTQMSNKAASNKEYKKTKRKKAGNVVSKRGKVKKTPFTKTVLNKVAKDLKDKSAAQIVQFVLDKTEEQITITLKSKKAIINKATKILGEYYTKRKLAKNITKNTDTKTQRKTNPKVKREAQKEVIFNIKGKKKSEIKDMIKAKFNETVPTKYNLAEVKKFAKKLCRDAKVKFRS